MKSKISLAFENCKKENRAALITYTVAGDNTKNNSLKILNKISKYADMKELKPNYTFRLARESYWTVKEISPSEWSERVSIEITKVEFKE